MTPQPDRLMRTAGRRLRAHLTYANTMSTLAVLIALGGTSYAAVSINGASIKNRSIAGTKLRTNTLTGRHVNEARLGRVPRAAKAELSSALDSLGGPMTVDDLLVRCPPDTFPSADVCVERTAHPGPTAYDTAVLTCSGIGRTAAPGRRLPTHGELRAALSAIELAPGGELTSDIYPSASDPGRLNVLYVTDKLGHIAVTPDTGAGGKAYRCVTDPLN